MESSIKRIINYIKGTMVELQNIVGSLGKKRIKDLDKDDLCATDEISSIVSGVSHNNKNYFRQITDKNRKAENQSTYGKRIGLKIESKREIHH
jgi:hypothetical protein